MFAQTNGPAHTRVSAVVPTALQKLKFVRQSKQKLLGSTATGGTGATLPTRLTLYIGRAYRVWCYIVLVLPYFWYACVLLCAGNVHTSATIPPQLQFLHQIIRVGGNTVPAVEHLLGLPTASPSPVIGPTCAPLLAPGRVEELAELGTVRKASYATNVDTTLNVGSKTQSFLRQITPSHKEYTLGYPPK